MSLHPESYIFPLESWSQNALYCGGFGGRKDGYFREGFRISPPQKNIHRCKCGCETPTLFQVDRPNGRYHVWCWKCGASSDWFWRRSVAVQDWNAKN